MKKLVTATAALALMAGAAFADNPLMNVDTDFVQYSIESF